MTDLERQLQEHARCVRSLAAALLDDHAAGHDIAQETMLAATRKALHGGPSLRAWMLRVGRRLASRWRRTEARRERREQVAARPEGLPSAADDAARAEQLQAIAAAVAALPPTLREVVLLRHYDDLAPRAIAARLSLSVEAVESRLRRAREQLRATLRAHAPDGDVRAGLLLFVGPGAWTPSLGVAAVTVKSKTLFASLAALLLLLACAAVWWWPEAGVGVEPAPPPIATAHLAEPPPTAALERSEVVPAAVGSPSRVPQPSWTTQVTGRVVDAWRHPVAAATVVAEIGDGTRAETRSDADGRFALTLAVTAWICHGEVLATKDTRAGTIPFARWTTMPESNDVGTIALTATGEVQVRVRRGAAAVAGAHVVGVRASFRPTLRYESTTGENGTAVLRGLPPGRYCIGATAADGSWNVGHVDAVAGRSTEQVLDQLASTPVCVEVRARGSEAPIAGAQIEALYCIDEVNLPAKIPLQLLVPLPRTDDAGQARLTGLCRGQVVGVSAWHDDWRPLVAWNAPPIDWNEAAPHAVVRLDALDTLTWRLCDGEVPVPPDGTMFTVSDMRLPVRDGCLHLGGLAMERGWSTTAVGPGCYAVLQVANSSPGAPASVSLQRTRRLEVELHDPEGQPLVGWPLRSTTNRPSKTVRTDADGRAIAEDLPAELMHVEVQSDGGPPMKDLGQVDLRRGDGHLTATLGPSRRVRAHVFVNGRAGLPGQLDLRVTDGRVEKVDEDVDRGVLTFELWLGRPDQRGQLQLFGMPGLTVGMATIAPGSEPAEIEFRLDYMASGTVNLVLPADGQSQIHVERFFVKGTSGWWGFSGTVDGRAPRRLDDLLPGRYRLHDTRSEVIGPEVEVTADGSDARLTLDLSKVVSAEGRVLASLPLRDIRVELRTAQGTVLQQKQASDDGSFWLCANMDQPGLVLVAVRGNVSSAPLPWTGSMRDVSLVLPQ